MASRLLAFIVGFLFSGLGYLFTNDYYYAIGVFAVTILLSMFGLIGILFACIIWVYSLIDVDRKIQLTNQIQ